jgi:hypothetical protein
VRSLTLRILLASLATVLASTAAFLITFFAMAGPATGSSSTIFRRAKSKTRLMRCNEEGRLSSLLSRQLNRSLGAAHCPTDADGGMSSAADRSALLEHRDAGSGRLNRAVSSSSSPPATGDTA